MNDYHLDPPDDHEPPEWMMTLEDVLEQMNPPQSVADAIRKAMDEWIGECNSEQDPEEPDFSEPDWQIHYAVPLRKCQHGNDPSNCDACDYAGDIAYDEARESKFPR